MKTFLCVLCISVAIPVFAQKLLQGTVVSTVDGIVICQKEYLPENYQGKYFALTNYPKVDSLAYQQRFGCYGNKIGIYQFNSTDGVIPIDLYSWTPIPDWADPEKIEAEKAAETVAKAKAAADKKEAAKETGEEAALKWNQSEADKGDAYGELRMGERYLHGEGVETNFAKAKEYFTSAAAQGNLSASNRLEQLK